MKEEILKKAKECLSCKTRPCSNACPMNTDIPEFIEKVKEDNLKEAYNILITNNVFSHVCSKVCPQENQCQGACVKGIKGEPTKIGELEEFVNCWAKENNVEPEIKALPIKTNAKVAIIGAGPAGLSCSYELIKHGIKSVVFEKEEIFGGILTYGIPDFRLDKKIVENIVKILKELGVEFKTGMSLGENITIEKLQKEFDYVFIGIGAELSSVYKLSEERIDGIYNSDEFLRAYNSKNYINNLGKTVVIGGGNVAMDAARAAIKMGAEKVSILYRRDKEHMPAREVELEEALNDGVIFKELTRVISADGNKVHCIKTKIVDGKAVDVEDEEFDYEANSVVFAIGLKPNKKILEEEQIELTDWGTIKVDEKNRTNIENVYAGGDVTDAKSVVCVALASGKNAANSIIKKIDGE